MNWSPYQISFLLDNVIYYTYNPAVKNASTWPFNEEQFLLLNVAMGGVAGTIPSNFTQATMDIDYVRVYQNTTLDTQSPTNFTASVGAVSGSTIELLLNANDNSGSVTYNVSYGSTNTSFANPSGVQKSVIISNLSPNTNYNFSITATDLAGNTNNSNTISLNATTTAVFSCSGSGTTAQQGAFTVGYNYAFETIGTDVKITFEMLDTDKVGVVAFLWKQSPFSETQMSNVSGNIFTKTISNQTIGATINYAVKFAYAGGLSTTTYKSYIVGSNCTLGTLSNNELDNFSFINPVDDFVIINSKNDIDKVQIFNMFGNLVLETTINTNKVAVKNLSKGIYLLAVYEGNKRSIKKMIVR
jgi:hypothetical protein